MAYVFDNYSFAITCDHIWCIKLHFLENVVILEFDLPIGFDKNTKEN